jgi:Na+-driven multidrug efflux pump
MVTGWSSFFEALPLGISSFFIQISLVFVTVASNLVLVHYGASTVYGSDIPVAVFGIVYKVFTIVVNIPIGIALGGAPIIGYNYGAKHYERVMKTYNLVLISSLVVTVLATLLFEISPMVVVSLFGNASAEYNDFAVRCFRIYLSCLILTGMQRTSSVFFQSPLGKPVQATILSLVRDLVLLVPLTALIANGNGAGWLLDQRADRRCLGFYSHCLFDPLGISSITEQRARSLL